MSERDAFERILDSLHEVAFDHARWSSASALIDEALRTHGSSMVFGEGDSAQDVRIHFAWIFSRGQRQREREREYYEVYYPLDERVPRLRHAPDSRLFHTTDLLTAEERKTSATYNDLLVGGPCEDSVHVRLDGPHGSRIVWIVQGPVGGKGWSSTQLDLIRRLLPHVRQTVRVQQALAGAGARSATLTELLDATGLGVMHLDAYGRIVAVNDRAQDVLRDGDGVFDEGGFLFARTPADDAGLQGLLSRALPPFTAQGEGGSMILRRPGARPPQVLHVVPVGRRRTDCFGSQRVAALAIVADPKGRTGVEPVVAAEALNLTRMEGRVAGDAGPWHERTRDCRGDGPQGEHDPLPRQAHVHQARPVAAGGAGAVGAVSGQRRGRSTLKAEEPSGHR